MASVKGWLEDQLRGMLGFTEVEDIANHLLSFSPAQEAELKDYLQQFLGDSKEVRGLCAELIAKQRGDQVDRVVSRSMVGTQDDFWGVSSSSLVGRTAGRSTPNQGQKQGYSKAGKTKKGKGKGEIYQKADPEDFWGGGKVTSVTLSSIPPSAVATVGQPPLSAPPAVTSPPTPAPSAAPARQQKAKKAPPTSRPARKTSSSSLKGKDGGAQRPPASKPKSSAATVPSSAIRAPPQKEQKWSGITCTCMATRHALVTNCTSCGKIACEAEGGYQCSFCLSDLPVTGREPRGSGSGSGSTDQRQPQSAALEAALARKEKLLLFDRTSAARTRVLDDHGDHFTSHNWLSRADRESAEAEEAARREQQAARRRKVKVSLDIMGRKVIEADPNPGGGEGGDLKENLQSSPSYGGGADRWLRDHKRAEAESYMADNSSSEAREEELGALTDRPSLRNAGLTGRAKEVYDIMRANLEKGKKCSNGQGRGRGRNLSSSQAAKQKGRA